MKLIKRVILPLLSTFIFMFCILFSACAPSEIVENDRKDKSGVGEFEVASWLLSSSGLTLGITFGYEYENAIIEINNSSEYAIIIFDKFSEIVNLEKYSDYTYRPYGGYFKQIAHKDCPISYSGDTTFQWAVDMDWWDWIRINREEQELSDYITFIARIDNNIVGYSVMHVYISGEEGGGAVLADKEFPQINGRYQEISEETVKEKIQSVIDEHKVTLYK